MSIRIQEIKHQLRGRIHSRRRHLCPELAARDSALICARTMALPELRTPGTALLYLAKGGEVDLISLSYALWDAGWKIAVLAREGASAVYQPCELAPDEVLERGPFDVSQPQQKRWIDPAALDVAFIPGLAFDPYGGRLGHGGGHYDRMLPQVRSNCTTVGVCFDFQFITCIPQQSHDIGMRVVVTERGLERCARG
jgi:5-formyltetrahydrofolate cyclo-ligase